MYTLPEEFDTNFLLDQELLSITIGINHVEFLLEPVRITVGSGLSCKLGNESKYPVESLQDSASHAVALLGKKISSVEKLGRTGIVLHFAEAGLIRLTGDDPSYECYHISPGNGDLYVV